MAKASERASSRVASSLASHRLAAFQLAEEEHGPAFVVALAERDILVDHRPEAGIRVSPHFYTTEDELARFAETLSDLRRTGSWREARGAGAY